MQILYFDVWVQIINNVSDVAKKMGRLPVWEMTARNVAFAIAPV